MKSLGNQLKEEGMEQVLEGEGETWKNTYVGLCRAYIRAHPQAFTSEQCKLYALSQGLTEPHSPNVWGAQWNAFTKRRPLAVIKTGHYVKSTEPKRHSNVVAEWCITDSF